MKLHPVKVHPSRALLKREEQLAWKMAAVATDKVAVEKDVQEMIVNRIIDNAAVLGTADTIGYLGRFAEAMGQEFRLADVDELAADGLLELDRQHRDPLAARRLLTHSGTGRRLRAPAFSFPGRPREWTTPHAGSYTGSL